MAAEYPRAETDPVASPAVTAEAAARAAADALKQDAATAATDAELASQQAANWPRDSLPSNVLYGVDPRNVQAVVAPASPTNRAFLVPAIVGKTGTLSSLYHLIGTSSGNVDYGVYRYSDANVRWDRLWSTGSIACPAANGWRLAGSPGLAVVAGEVLTLVYAANNGTATFGRTLLGSNQACALPFSLGANASSVVAGAFDSAFPLPTTLTAGAFIQISTMPALLGKID